jgi:hypothetical protein
VSTPGRQKIFSKLARKWVNPLADYRRPSPPQSAGAFAGCESTKPVRGASGEKHGYAKCPSPPDGSNLSCMSDVTQIIDAIGRGDEHASEQLLPMIYQELRRLAGNMLAQEPPGQTLQATRSRAG